MSFRSSVLVVTLASLAPLTALAQRCDAATLGDAVCDCGCGVTDPACSAGSTFAVCVVSHCPAGQVPWEHGPSQCMSSACGDGWKDSASGEACDDGNALAGGGCSADCKTVTPGYVCGEGAAKCKLAPADAGNGGSLDAGHADAGQPVADAGNGGEVDAGSDPDPTPAQSGGCAATPGLSLLGVAALLVLRRSRRG
jgi:cysteine-rich repeat protein